ncbi:MAG: glycosyltransferase [Oligoflexia bacterium]|nr:glycosyltransferase [Oligoflexia bacterium]
MNDLEKLARLMKSDWDRRVRHDYRFWMSDGHKSDDEMWQAGERDFNIISKSISDTASKTLLEIGCGVGRLLRPALRAFAHVVGFDVSQAALDKARELLGPNPKLTLQLGNGFDLQPIPAASVDVVVSFAAMTVMPTDVIASYLLEIHRVLKPDGVARLQLYYGSEYRVCREDTLHVRCYAENNLRSALQAAGFDVQSFSDLELPFQVSFDEIGIRAAVISVRKSQRAPVALGELSHILLPGGEVEVSIEHSPQDLEHWTALNYARQLAEQGQVTKAKETLEYALRHSQNTTIDTRDLLNRIVSEIEGRGGTVPKAEVASTPGSVFEYNLAVLERRFPDLAKRMRAFSSPQRSVEIRSTTEGGSIWYQGQCLDHPTKPLSGAEAWVKREESEKRTKDCSHIVVGGFGLGYHVEKLLARGEWQVSVIEPLEEVFWVAIQQRDLRSCLGSLRALVVGEQSEIDCLDERTELSIRPQHQPLNPEFWTGIRANFYGTRGLLALSPKIGVLGPIQGGTLPMLSYCMRGLYAFNQRPRDLDMSGFASGYHLAEKFVNGKIHQQALQGTYIEMMSQFVLQSLLEKPVDILICMAQAPASGRILTELRNRGVITVLWFVEDYTRFTYWKDIAQYYDFVFTIQKGECIEAIRGAGAGEVHYLPTAFDPFVHRPLVLSEEEKKTWGSPVSFVGAGYHNRQQVFASMAEFPLKLWGTEWPACRPFDRLVQDNGRRLTPEEYVKIFSATDVNINLHSSTERDGVDPFGDFVNPRTFELAGCGAFQLVDQRSLLGEVFEDGKELISFANPNDLRDKVRYYMQHPEERAQIAAAGRERAMREHTYAMRLKRMLSIIYSSRFEGLKRRQDASPWTRMLERSKIDSELHQRCEIAFRRGEEPILDGLVSDIVAGKGRLSETEQKLLFLFHIRKQIIRMKAEETGQKAG